jgi:predicted transcriptional regulator
MRTTLTLDDDLGARLEALAREGRRSFKDVVNEVLRRGLDAKPPRARPFQVKARDLGLKPGVELDDIGDLLEQLDGAAHK